MFCLFPLGHCIVFFCIYGAVVVVIDTSLCERVCQWLANCRWFSPGTLVSCTNNTHCHAITEILLKVALNTKTKSNQSCIYRIWLSSWYLQTVLWQLYWLHFKIMVEQFKWKSDCCFVMARTSHPSWAPGLIPVFGGAPVPHLFSFLCCVLLLCLSSSCVFCTQRCQFLWIVHY